MLVSNICTPKAVDVILCFTVGGKMTRKAYVGFIQRLCVCVHVYMGAINLCGCKAHVCTSIWKLKDNLCCYSSVAIQLMYLRVSCGTCSIWEISWLGNPEDFPVSTPLRLSLQAYIIMPEFFTWVLRIEPSFLYL